MRKRFFTFLFALFGIMPAVWADDGVWIEKLNGTKQGFLFSQQPQISYTADALVMTTTAATATFPLDELKRIYFDGNVVNAINAVAGGGSAQLMRATAVGAELSGFPAGTAVTVYALSGSKMAQLRVPSDGQLTVDLSAFPQGIYMIQAEKVTLKIQKK